MKKFISFPSISTDIAYKEALINTAAYLVDLLNSYGIEAEAIPGYGNPIVVGEYIVDPALPTYLVYGHYDVQPASLDEGRDQDPFDLHIGEEKITARGAVDNKGQIMIHITTIGKLIQEKKLKYNIKYMIEGDEETGSPYLAKFVEDYKDRLACDVVMVSDGEIIGDHTPTIGAGFRGGCNMTLTLTTADVDLHSGIYGGLAPNSAYEATKLLGQLFDEKNWLTIEGYYDTVEKVSDEERANNESLPFDEEDTKTTTGIKALLIQEGYDAMSANGLMPTIQISGLQSGYTGSGYRNAIPHKTIIKLNFRFARGQNPETTISQFVDWVGRKLPAYVTYEVEVSDPYPAIRIDTSHITIKKAQEILTALYGKNAVLRYCGAAIPVTGLFQSVLGAAVIIADLANDDCRMHGVGENFKIHCIQKGLDFSERFFSS